MREENIRKITLYSPQILLGQLPTVPLRPKPFFPRRGAFWPNAVAHSGQTVVVQQPV